MGNENQRGGFGDWRQNIQKCPDYLEYDRNTSKGISENWNWQNRLSTTRTTMTTVAVMAIHISIYEWYNYSTPKQKPCTRMAFDRFHLIRSALSRVWGCKSFSAKIEILLQHRVWVCVCVYIVWFFSTIYRVVSKHELKSEQKYTDVHREIVCCKKQQQQQKRIRHNGYVLLLVVHVEQHRTI